MGYPYKNMASSKRAPIFSINLENVLLILILCGMMCVIKVLLYSNNINTTIIYTTKEDNEVIVKDLNYDIDDLSYEYNCLYGYKKKPLKKKSLKALFTLPKKKDWREENVISPVLNQEECNSCWAFSIAGVMETMQAIKYNQSVTPLSVQELVDCIGEIGCHPVQFDKVLYKLCKDRLKITKSEAYYPYNIHVTQSCNNSLCDNGIQLLKYMIYKEVEEIELIQLLNEGTVMALIDILQLRFYDHGVVQYNCDSDHDQTHVVQIVGYVYTDSMDPPPHLIVKNSFGVDWGENGYFRLAIANNVCGIYNNIYKLNVD